MALSLHSAATAHLTCTYALRVMVIIPRRSEWWRSATLTAGPCVSLPLNRQLQTSCLVGLGRSPVSCIKRCFRFGDTDTGMAAEYLRRNKVRSAVRELAMRPVDLRLS